LVAKNFSLLLKHKGEDSLSILGVIFGTVAIHKDVLLSRVTMKVAEDYDISLLLDFPDSLFHMV
jgi:hypothetical protein